MEILVQKYLKDRGLEVDSYIPNRLEEGYGLNKQAIKRIKDDGYNLIITVDCGISGMEKIQDATWTISYPDEGFEETSYEFMLVDFYEYFGLVRRGVI